MGIAKINGKDYTFEDREYEVNLKVNGGDIVINDQYILRVDPLEPLVIEAYDLKGHKANFSNVGVTPKVTTEVEVVGPQRPNFVKRALLKKAPSKHEVGQILTENLIEDIGWSARSLQRQAVRGVMKKGLFGLAEAIFGKPPKKKK